MSDTSSEPTVMAGVPAGSAGEVTGRLRSREYYRDLIWTLLVKEFKVRYKNTVLGYGWSVLHPLLFTLVYFFLFKVVLKVQIENYTLFLVAGVFPWQAFQNSVGAGSSVFISNSSLIKKLNFPRELMVLTGVLNDLSHFVLSIPIIVLTMAWYNVAPQWDCLWAFPLVLAAQLLFTLGLTLITATCNLFFRDLERLIGIIIMLWFYVTPVLFREDWIPDRLQWTNYANPMAAIVITWRHIFMGTSVGTSEIIAACAWAVITFCAGYLLFRHLNWRFAELV